ncbi:MAG: HlyC/CorC family transporter [Pseudomonadota bacterium]
MTTTLILTALAVLILLCLSGFFSGSETALTAASRARMHQLERSGDVRAKLVNSLIGDPDRLIGGILLGNNLMNILASVLATNLFLTLFGDAGVFFTTFIMTGLVVVFAEVLPKTYAIWNADRMSLFVARPLSLIVSVLAPITAAVVVVVRRVLELFGANSGDQSGDMAARDEIRGAIDLHHKEGAVVKDDRDMLGGILDLKELEVSDIMIHRTKMETINADDTPEEIVRQVIESPYTRIPLWRDNPENIIGILHAKDLVRAMQRVEGKVADLDLMSVTSKPWYVPDTTTLQDQLRNFLRRKAHFALVVDEYGVVQGLVTLEDILEEIVGEINDEHDVSLTGVSRAADGSITVDGSVPIRDLNRAMDWSLPDDEATTIAGLVIHEAQQIPDSRQVFTFYGFRFEVVSKNRNRISKLKVTPLATAASAVAA